MNIKENRSKQIQKKILSKLGKTFNLNRIYDFCMRQFGKGRIDIRQKYARILAHLHLMNQRRVQQEKQQNFIRQWRGIIESKSRFNYYPYLQELIKLLEMIDLRMKQVPILMEFLVDVTTRNWDSLKSVIFNRFKVFKEKIETILQAIYFKKHNKEGKQQKQMQFIIQSINSEQNGEYSSNNFEQIERKIGQDESFININKSVSSNPYLVGPAKLFFKEKPQAVKLLTKQQLHQLRQNIASRNKSIISPNKQRKIKQIEKQSPVKFKKQNFKTYHTEIDEDSDEWNSKQESYKVNDIQQPKKLQKFKKPIYRHHKSNVQDYATLKKHINLQGSLRYRSIHKVQGSEVNHSQPPSRYTIQSSSVNLYKNSDNNTPNVDSNSKKIRASKVSIISKLSRTIQNIEIKSNKKQRGGVFLDKGKLKEIQEIYNTFQQNQQQQNEGSDEQKAQSQKSSKQLESKLFKRNSQLVGFIKKSNELFQQTSSQKEFSKRRRRIGVSTKVIKSKKSVDLYSVPAKHSQSQKNSKIHNRTSIFRSSGFGEYSEQKKSNVKSRYRNQSHGVIKPYNPDEQFYEGMESKFKEKAQRRFALNKKSNQKLLTQPTAVTIDKNSIISFSDMANVLGEIHHQDKEDRAGKYQQYYMQVFKRKYEGHNRSIQLFSEFNPDILKMDKSIQYLPPKRDKILHHQALLFDLMIKTSKQTNGLALLQTGTQSPLQ